MKGNITVYFMSKATFNNISVVYWLSVLFVEETRVPKDNNRAASSHWQTVSPNLSGTLHHERDSNSQ